MSESLPPKVEFTSSIDIKCGVCGKIVSLKQIDQYTSYYKEICECKNEWILQRLY